MKERSNCLPALRDLGRVKNNKSLSKTTLKESLALFSLSMLYSAFLLTGVINTLSIALMSAAFLLILFTFMVNLKVTPLFILLFFYAAYRLIYYFAVNTNIPIDINFINEEGRFLVFLIVTLAISALQYNTRVLKKYVKFSMAAFLLWASLFALDSILGNTLINASHHQLGLISLTGLIYGVFLQNDSLFWRLIKWFAIALSIICLIFSGSRTSLVLGVFLLFWVYQNRVKIMPKLLGAGLLTIAIVFNFNVISNEKFTIANRNYDISSFGIITDGIAFGISNPDAIEKAADGRKSGIKDADGNIIGRAVVYGKAIHLFMESPLFGVGEGRFDDNGSCKNIGSAVCIHNHGKSQFDGHTAHNSFLHILAEEGLLGFLFVLIILLKLKNLIMKRSFLIKSKGLNPAAITAVWWCFILASLFQHTLASPLYAFSFLLPLIVVANTRLVDNADTFKM